MYIHMCIYIHRRYSQACRSNEGLPGNELMKLSPNTIRRQAKTFQLKVHNCPRDLRLF